MTPETARRLLGLPVFHTAAQIEQRFRSAARQVHPDRGGTAAEFQLLVRARQVAQDSVSQPRRPSGPSSSTPPRVVVVDTRPWWKRAIEAVGGRLRGRTPRKLH